MEVVAQVPAQQDSLGYPQAQGATEAPTYRMSGKFGPIPASFFGCLPAGVRCPEGSFLFAEDRPVEVRCGNQSIQLAQQGNQRIRQPCSLDRCFGHR